MRNIHPFLARVPRAPGTAGASSWRRRAQRGLAGLTLACASLGGAQAHDAWVEPVDSGYAAYFGHDGELEAARPEKVARLLALDAQGRALEITQTPGEAYLGVAVQGKPILLVMDYDNGFWARAPGGSQSVNKPRNEVPGAVSGSHTVKFSKTVLDWSAPGVRQQQGQKLEIVPLDDRAPRAGGTLAVQVLWNGQPLPQAHIVSSGSRDVVPIVADAQGQARIPVGEGRQFFSVNQKEVLRDDPRADIYSAAANLLFVAQP